MACKILKWLRQEMRDNKVRAEASRHLALWKDLRCPKFNEEFDIKLRKIIAKRKARKVRGWFWREVKGEPPRIGGEIRVEDLIRNHMEKLKDAEEWAGKYKRA